MTHQQKGRTHSKFAAVQRSMVKSGEQWRSTVNCWTVERHNGHSWTVRACDRMLREPLFPSPLNVFRDGGQRRLKWGFVYFLSPEICRSPFEQRLVALGIVKMFGCPILPPHLVIGSFVHRPTLRQQQWVAWGGWGWMWGCHWASVVLLVGKARPNLT